MINAQLDGVARTMLLTLRARAEEQDQASPILTDSWSADWYEHMPTYDDLDAWYNAPFQLATVIRSAIIDEMASSVIEQHDSPLVVELGAGLSTRYFRIGEGKSRWIDLDMPEAMVVRRKLDMAVTDHWFIAADFVETDEWLAQLPDAKGKDVIFIAEGALMFAEKSKVEALIETLKQNYKGAMFIFDVINPSYVDRANEAFEKFEAPMQWGIEPKKVKSLGVKVDETRFLLTEYGDRVMRIQLPQDYHQKRSLQSIDQHRVSRRHHAIRFHLIFGYRAT
jgi:O-methyltransferase involved in polyketide biosynthesis